jgi:trehalose 6-phosphate synthase/phosphatase
MSSRDKDTLEKWFGKYDFLLFAEHGIWEKSKNEDWQLTSKLWSEDWKTNLKPVIEKYVDRTPGSYLEEMKNVLSWYYEKADPDHGALRARELKDELSIRILNMNLQIADGRKVIEVKPTAMNKGFAAVKTISDYNHDFIMAVGDDWTDEYLFELLPPAADTIRVGMKKTHARYNCESYQDVRKLLRRLSSSSSKKKLM